LSINEIEFENKMHDEENKEKNGCDNEDITGTCNCVHISHFSRYINFTLGVNMFTQQSKSGSEYTSNPHH